MELRSSLTKASPGGMPGVAASSPSATFAAGCSRGGAFVGGGVVVDVALVSEEDAVVAGVEGVCGTGVAALAEGGV